MPDNKIYLAFDFGLKNIGVASGGTLTKTANPLKIIKAKDGMPDLVALDKIIALYQPHAFVVGLPVHLDGSDSNITPKARGFATIIKKRYNRQVFFVDERDSSKTALSMLQQFGKVKPGDRVDAASAKVILESFFQGY